MTNKKDDKITAAGAVELEENELDQVTGGAGFLKIGDIKGEIKIPDLKGGIKDVKPIARPPGAGFFPKVE